MSTSEKLKELTKHFLVYGFGNIAQSLAGFILLPILTSHLVPEVYGIYSIIVLCSTLAGTVFYLGITSSLPRSYFETNDELKRKEVLSTSFYLILAGAFIQILLGFLFSEMLSEKIFKSTEYTLHFQVMFVASAIAFLNTFFQTFLRLLNRSKAVVLLGVIASAIQILSVVILLNGVTSALWAPIIGFLLSQIFIFVQALFLIHKHLIIRFNKIEAGWLLKLGVPTVIASFAVMGIEWSDRFFINQYLSLADVGIYSLAYKIGSLMTALYVSPFTQIWNPIMMRERLSEDIKILFKKVLVYYFLIGSVFLLITTLSVNEFAYVLIKNKDYFVGLKIAPYIMSGLLIYGSVNILMAGLWYSRKINMNTIIFCFVAILNLILNYLLIPTFGYTGAALSSFLTYAIIPPLIHRQAKKYFSFEIDHLKLFLLFLVTFIAIPLLLMTESLALTQRLGLKFLITIVASYFMYYFIVTSDEKIQIKNFLKQKGIL